MGDFFRAFGLVLYQRVWLSYKSTFFGLLVAGFGELLNYYYLSVPDPRVHALCALLTAAFASWKEKHVKDGSIKLIAFAFLFLSLGAMAAGGTPSARTHSGGTLEDVAPSDPLPVPMPTKPQISGCVKNGKICFGPTFALSVAALNLSKGTVEGSFSPGVGAGVTFNAGTWSSFGLDLYLNLDPGAQRASGALMLKALNGYLRAGYSKGFVGDTSHRLLFGTGIDL